MNQQSVSMIVSWSSKVKWKKKSLTRLVKRLSQEKMLIHVIDSSMWFSHEKQEKRLIN